MPLKRRLVCATRTEERPARPARVGSSGQPRPRGGPVSKWDLLGHLEEAGETGVTAWEVSDAPAVYSRTGDAQT
jgi:hypothetical protein